MRLRYLITVLNPSLLAISLLSFVFLTLRPAQAAPSSRPNQADVLVTTTIQAAINATTPGDTVIVPAGTYTESLTLSKAVSLTGVSSATTIIYALPNQRVLTITGATISNSVVISGLTLTGGKSTSGSGFGGGILVTNNARPLLQSLIVSNNQALFGGGIWVDFSIPLTLVNVAVISNSATIQGGGLLGGGPITLSYSRFERNIAINGGGGGLVVAALNVTNSQFISNSATGFGGGVGVIGPATLTGGYFENNTSSSGGGGLYADSALTITNTQFLRNRADLGGGIYRVGTSNGQIVNTLFANNIVTNTGVALYINSSGNMTVLHTTIADTTLNPKVAIEVFSGTVGITNTIITSYSIAIGRVGGAVSEDYNLFFGNTVTTAGGVVSGGHSLTGAPRFAAPASDDYHLGSGSTALNIAFPGLANSDFESDPRPLGIGPDIGFDESSFAPALTIAKTIEPVNLLTPGQILTYTIVVANNGEAAANNVLITDTFPASITGASFYTTSTVPAGQSAIFTLTGTLTNNVLNGAVITNTAYYSYTSSAGQSSVAFTIAAPSLIITKAVTPPGLLAPGQAFTYTIVVANNGDADATNTLIADIMPTPVIGTNLFTTTTIPANQSVTFTLLATLATDITSDTIITNTAFYSHTSGTGQTSAAFIAAVPDLSLTKTITPTSSLTPGQALTYTIVVVNRGSIIANNVLISDTLPTSVIGTSLFTTSTISPHQSVIFTLPATVVTDISGRVVITNTAFYHHTSGNGQSSAISIVQNSSPNFWIYLPAILKN